MALGWLSASGIPARGWTCGYCGKEVGGDQGYRRENSDDSKFIYICPRCQNPTAFIKDDGGYLFSQYPDAPYGSNVTHLPHEIASLYSEIRRCIQYTAYTSAVLSIRKLLMHIAVERGAEPNERFVTYVKYLDDNHFIPPDCKPWVEKMKDAGNEATHEIVLVDERDAKRLLDFTEMLLRFLYEFPGKLSDVE